MKETIKLTTPFAKDALRGLHAGDEVLLTGTIYTARDAAHKRFVALIDNNEPLPMPLNNQILYYCGPTPPPPGQRIGSAGPTTSSRMDPYTPALLKKTGLTAMIGKGGRSEEVVKAMKKHHAVYFAAVGGAGALISSCVKSAEIACYEDLGPEAVYRFEVENLPLIVAVDSYGNDLYKSGPSEYLKTLGGK